MYVFGCVHCGTGEGFDGGDNGGDDGGGGSGGNDGKPDNNVGDSD
jgi:hypothetical protein